MAEHGPSEVIALHEHATKWGGVPCAYCQGDGDMCHPGNLDAGRKIEDWLPPVACGRCGGTGVDPDRSSVVGRQCSECGAALSPGSRHRHEDPKWTPRFDDFEGALEGYVTESSSPDREGADRG